MSRGRDWCDAELHAAPDSASATASASASAGALPGQRLPGVTELAVDRDDVLARVPHEELEALFTGYGYRPYFVEGHEPPAVHQKMAETLDVCIAEIRRIQKEARVKGRGKRPRWPIIVLRTPKGWTCPREIDGKRCEDY